MPRKETRHPAHAEAKIVFGQGQEISCTICNTSPDGALLMVPFSEWLPPRFELQDGSGVRRHVILAWQGSEHVGVRYAGRPPRRRGPQFGRRQM
jgi:hypothetical protein